ncbi:MAG: hypothetical protein R3C01_10045 [Planctomycetaceae bacterium]
MNDSYVVPVLCGMLILLCTLLAVVVAYREGKRIGALTRSDRFDRLTSPLALSETEWQIEFDEYEAKTRHTAWMRFRQYGSRIIGEGEDSEGRCCSAEGVVYADKLCYLYLERGRGGHSLGTVMVDMNDAGDQFDGMRCSWSVDRGAVSVDRIRLTREKSSPGKPLAQSHSPMVHSGDACSEKATSADLV